jgi:hypothetical protein
MKHIKRCHDDEGGKGILFARENTNHSERGGKTMKQSGKTRGHAHPRKQSVRLPVLLSKHCFLSRFGSNKSLKNK